MNLYEDIGKRLEEERKKLGLSAIEVYSELEIAQTTFKNYEQGKRDIPASLLQKLWNHNFDILYIVTGTYFEEPSTATTFGNYSLNRLVQIPENINDSVMSDKTLLALYSVEDGLLRAGAVANEDYSMKDLIILAQNIRTGNE